MGTCIILCDEVCCWMIRNSHPSARVKLQSLYKFLQGHLAPPVKEMLEDVRQFIAFFPPHLHRQSRYKGTYKVIESMVFIDDPDLTFLKEEDVERFKRLSGLPELALDREEARNYQHGQRNDRDDDRQVPPLCRKLMPSKCHSHQCRAKSTVLCARRALYFVFFLDLNLVVVPS